MEIFVQVVMWVDSDETAKYSELILQYCISDMFHHYIDPQDNLYKTPIGCNALWEVLEIFSDFEHDCELA